MQTITSRKAVSELLEKARNEGKKAGFVPTMGALHEGHAALVRKARGENDLVIVSVFVNPTQFNDKSDLANYPRTLLQDQVLLGRSGCDLLFFPSVEEMYPEGLEAEKFPLDLEGLDSVMEGKFRPGHFEGVVRVVKKLFEIVGECNAYFGQKDFQQLAIIRKMVEVLKLPVNIIGCPTVREKDGLAMSSRNTRLTETERKAAPEIYAALTEAKRMWGRSSVEEIKKEVESKISLQPLFKLDYFEIADERTLAPRSGNSGGNAVACIAVFLGKVRLIDNILLR
ncbi:MAG TPA: pantoate--beta-alanine ligase [Bacteroidia bacterium]|jgi:pantoate--beta-alanine ligase|nr:pantoate--beta-alanine ligase [Bacteroidia bacterium]